MKKTMFIIVAVLLAAAIFGGLGYALSSMKQSGETSDAPSDTSQEMEAVSDPLTEATSLLPDPARALGVRKMSDTLYWAWTSDPSGDDTHERENTTWIVDTDKKEVVETFSRKDYNPMEPSITFQPGERYYEVDWDNGWEGIWSKTSDFFDLETGKLAYTLILNLGQEAVIQSGDKELSITLDPPIGCEDALTDVSKETVTVTGLNINGTSYPFAAPKTAECTVNELLGSGFYPEFKFIVLSPSENLIRLGLPWDGAYAELPIPDLDPEEIRYR